MKRKQLITSLIAAIVLSLASTLLPTIDGIVHADTLPTASVAATSSKRYVKNILRNYFGGYLPDQSFVYAAET